MPVAEAITGKAIFYDVIKKLSVNVVLGIGKEAIRALGNIERDYGAHLKQSFDKCTKIRTILNRDEPADLLSLYINLKFSLSSSEIDDYSFIEKLPRIRHAVISGTGGGGKTMFMKYLWLSLFEQSTLRIPLFIELRRFNDLTTEEFGTFLFKSAVAHDSKIQKSDFEAALAEGAFTILLDGFDEINEERRGAVEAEILRISKSYPDTQIVVSGRPDERFEGWQSFSVFKVMPLSKPQVIELITRLKYDEKIKLKFIQRIKKDLYDKHSSFLSSPLLATMMLLTFDQFADIPEKIYLFYDQAFGTLYAKHDATKEAYKRKSYTGLSIDLFKKLLAYFCLISYYEEKYEFTDSEVLVYLKKAIKMLGQPVDAEKFLHDLQESVCLLQRDGLNLNFTHRSFQEFFSAYCLAYLVSGRMREICPNLLNRGQDNVLPMCFDMNQELFEAEFIKPELEVIVKAFSNVSEEELFKEYLKYFECSLVCHNGPDMKSRIFPLSHSHSFKIRSLLRKLYPKYFQPKRSFQFNAKDRKFMESTLSIEHRDTSIYAVSVDGYDSEAIIHWMKEYSMKKTRGIKVEQLEATSFANLARAEVTGFNSLLKNIGSRATKRARSIDSIFNLN